VYKVGLHANALLESIAELTIAYLLLRQAEIAAPKAEDDAFYLGKVEAARFFVTDVAPKVADRRADAESEDGSLMNLPIEAF
jgi:hypothetical protein